MQQARASAATLPPSDGVPAPVDSLVNRIAVLACEVDNKGAHDSAIPYCERALLAASQGCIELKRGFA